jgi:hypothetical protein
MDQPQHHDLRCDRPSRVRVGELRQQRQEQQKHLWIEPADPGPLRRLAQLRPGVLVAVGLRRGGVSEYANSQPHQILAKLATQPLAPGGRLKES